MKITFIMPAIGKKEGQPYIRTWKMEPLMFGVLKALTPLDIEVEFFDDRLELIDYQTKTDLVALTLESYTALRSYDIAKKFRDRNIPVVMGGHHATLLPEEAIQFSDSVIVGNAETVWKQVIQDVQNKKLQKFYHGKTTYHSILPDRSIFANKKYTPISLVETGRGCPFQCEFCDITSYYKASYHPRPIEDILKDVQESKSKFFFFVDDNIVAHPRFALKLFKALVPLKIQWGSQGTLTVAKNPELLKWMKKSGCCLLLIGFESLDPVTLKEMKKDWALKLGEKNELVKKIHSSGINIYATFVFGFDHDTPSTFQTSLDFARYHQFFFVAFNHLLPFPGTPLYERLKKENRLINEKWWLDPNYEYGKIAFQPKQLTPEGLSKSCANIRRKFFRFSSILKRSLQTWRRTPRFSLLAVYFQQNFNLKKEVDQKLGLPLGKGLDELPK